MTDPIATAAARATAQRLATEYGPGLTTDVEAVLHAQETAQRPGQYIDPISLGSLIVAIATLAWSIYSDQRKRTPSPPPDVVTRRVRIEMRKKNNNTSQRDTDRITKIIVSEIIQATQDQG